MVLDEWTDNPKLICPVNFFEVGGIKTSESELFTEQNRTEQNFIGNYKTPATPRWHKSKPYKYKIQEAYKTHTCYMYNIHSREFKCRFINNISKFEGKGVCLNGSLFYHENLFIIILTNFARFERTFKFVLVINDLNFSILGL